MKSKDYGESITGSKQYGNYAIKLLDAEDKKSVVVKRDDTIYLYDKSLLKTLDPFYLKCAEVLKMTGKLVIVESESA